MTALLMHHCAAIHGNDLTGDETEFANAFR